MSPSQQLRAYWLSAGSSPSPSGVIPAGGMPFPPGDPVDGDCGDAPPADGELFVPGVAVAVALAVSVESLLFSNRASATPIAASTTTPATISVMRVFLCPLGG